MFKLLFDKGEEKQKELEVKKEEIIKEYEDNIFINKSEIINFISIIYGYLFILILSINILFITMFYKTEIQDNYKNNFLISLLSIILHLFTFISLLLRRNLSEKYFYKQIVAIVFIFSTIYSYGLLFKVFSLSTLILWFSYYSIFVLFNFFYCVKNSENFNLFKCFIWNFVSISLLFLITLVLYHDYFFEILFIYIINLFYGFYINKLFLNLLNDKEKQYDLENDDMHLFVWAFFYSFFGIIIFLKEVFLVKFCLIPKYIKELFNFLTYFLGTLKCDLFKFLLKLICIF